MQLNILKLLDSHAKGGIFTCEQQFIIEERNSGHNVDGVIIGNGDKRASYQSVLNRYYHVDQEFKYRELRQPGSIFSAGRFSRKMAKKIAGHLEVNYDVIFYRKHFFVQLAGVLGKMMDTRVYWFMPNSLEYVSSRIYYRLYLKRFKIIPVANSRYTMDKFGKICRHFVYPGHQGAAVVKGKPTFREDLGISKELPVYGVAARIVRDKAHDLVIQAFRNSEIVDAGGHLVIAGGPLKGDYFQYLKEVAGDLLDQQIHFLGQLNRDEMPAFYSSIDLVINGRRGPEPFGITIAEAMAYGKPVIAYHLGGPSEMIADGENGWIVKDCTVESYKEKFNLSILHKDRWDEMGKDSLERSEFFGSTKSVEKLIEIFQKYQ